MMIALIDYGIGNIRSVEKALASIGTNVLVTDYPGVLHRAEKVILPGVGAFGDGMTGLIERNLVDPIRDYVQQGRPVLGICLGMQLMFDGSSERGDFRGLGFLKGQVRAFDFEELKVPQTGWNKIIPCGENPLLDGLGKGNYAYFNHSYYCDAEDERQILGETVYGISYPSVAGSGNLYGVQFHPEKSQSVGLKILRNFVENI